MGVTVAIIGSGPGGFYAATALTKEIEDCQVDIIDRLPTPYGLIRAGVAPDHQSMKKVSGRFEKTAGDPRVRFLGNVEVDKDLTLAELRSLYDAVVIATGAPIDRKLGIPGEDLDGVFGSAEFVGWYNAHPDQRELAPSLESGTMVVIGAGNVALDVARMVAKTGDEVRVTDMAHYAVDEIDTTPINDIYIYARRGPLQAAFTHKEVQEFGHLERAIPLVDPAVLPPEDIDLTSKGRGNQEKNIALLRDYASNSADDKPVRIHMEFYAMPLEILGEDQVTGIRMERTTLLDDGSCVGTGETFDLACNVVVSCIGTESTVLEGAPFDEQRNRFVNDNGKIEDGLYASGWARRGPSGTIGTNHPDGADVANLVKELTPDTSKGGPEGLDALLAERNVKVVTFEDWKRIEAAEEEAAAHGAPRRKFTSIDEMLSLLD
ncbi:MAG: FAD-dependent oxidoreductase [Alphaproteobacteria bacterium]